VIIAIVTTIACVLDPHPAFVLVPSHTISEDPDQI